MLVGDRNLHVDWFTIQGPTLSNINLIKFALDTDVSANSSFSKIMQLVPSIVLFWFSSLCS